jgi:hypothetical protein
MFLNYYGYSGVKPAAAASSYKTTLEINRSPYLFSDNTFSTVTNGAPPYNYFLQSGAIPTGLSLLTTSCYRFNGLNYLRSTASNSNLAMTGVSFTIEFWFNATSGNQGGLLNLTDITSSGSAGTSIYLDPNGILSFFITGNRTSYSTAASTIATNTWYHVALVFVKGGTNAGVATIYVNGNVSITGDIKYVTTGWSLTPTNTIPSLKIIATGDIVIDPNVTQLDGVYETTGYIYDCSTHTSGANIGLYQNHTGPGNNLCYTNPLTVNGSFIANRIFFQRTGGNAYTSGSPAAETFNYGPEDWLSSPDSSTGREDSLKSLPPVF